MRIATLKQVLSIIAVSAVTMLGAGQVAANGGQCQNILYLHLEHDQNPATPDELTLVNGIKPTSSIANFVDSPALGRGTYKPIAQWEEGYVGGNPSGCTNIIAIGPVNIWLGLRNSDDQGTIFDVYAEVLYKPLGAPPNSAYSSIATAERTCIKGLTRNPALAQAIQVGGFQTISPPLGDGEIALRLSARVASTDCGSGHNSATGLRVYYDSSNFDSNLTVFQQGT